MPVVRVVDNRAGRMGLTRAVRGPGATKNLAHDVHAGRAVNGIVTIEVK
jgi:hypothetical protein